jgi:hypothetical protein
MDQGHVRMKTAAAALQCKSLEDVRIDIVSFLSEFCIQVTGEYMHMKLRNIADFRLLRDVCGG